MPHIGEMYTIEEYFQEDKAPLHYHSMRDFLRCKGSVEHPSQSVNLMPLDFCLWSTVYREFSNRVGAGGHETEFTSVAISPATGLQMCVSLLCLFNNSLSMAVRILRI
jgi:hypothetical protein